MIMETTSGYAYSTYFGIKLQTGMETCKNITKPLDGTNRTNYTNDSTEGTNSTNS